MREPAAAAIVRSTRGMRVMNLADRPGSAARRCVALLAAFACTANAAAQSVFDGYAPNLSSSGLFTPGVRAVAVQSDGSMLLGGDIAGVNCARLCRVSADGRVDNAFEILSSTSLPDGVVNAILALPDGKVLIGGAFTSVGEQTRNRVARLNADGSLDVGFYDPGANRSVNAMALQPDGKILIGGAFTTVIGQPYGLVARLNANGTLDTSFADPGVSGGFDGTVNALAVQADGRIVIGGDFYAVGGQARSGMARLNADGSLDASFADPGANSQVNALAVLADGKTLVAGDFTTIGGQGRGCIARLNSDGGVDMNFAATLALNRGVLALSILPDGKIMIGGKFDNVDGQTHSPVARLNSDGSLDASFTDPGAFLDSNNIQGWIYGLAVQPDGKAVIGGDFVKIDSKQHAFAMRLTADGRLDTGLPNLAPDGYVTALAEQTDGRMLLGGYFTQMGGQPRHGAARVDADGGIDAGFVDPGLNNTVIALAVQADGKVLAGGAFTQAGAESRSYLARLNADGSLDSDFADAGLNGEVFVLAVQPDGKLLVGGDFTLVHGQTRNRLARLNADGSLDAGFADAGANDRIFALVVQADGRILAGGTFSAIGGQMRDYLARLNADGTLDAGFAEAGVDNAVLALALQADGKALVGGTFNQIGGATRHFLARMNADGSLDPGFADANANFWVLTLAAHADGRILAGGGFSQIGGRTRSGLARLNADGSLDEGFADIAAAGGVVYALAAQSDGKLMLGGNFSTIQSAARIALARLSVPDAALQSLDLQGDTATWHRSGSATELARPPTLYAAADCANYSAIGVMARVAGGWQRSGVSTPFGWSCLRARGRTRGGQGNGSQGLIESVRRVWRDDRLFADGFD
jgi:uncharacterized delta-60 repeat protein